MKSFNRTVISVLLLAAMLQVAALGQFFVDPNLQWKTLETEHFRIIFHQGLEGLAQEAALVAEESYQILAKEFDYAPAGKTNIVIVDATDFANGFASPLPNNDIVIFTSYADMSSWANVRIKSWLQMVIFHEYVHIVDLDRVSGPSKILRDIFGKISLPNASKPTFFIEGIAAYEKFKYLGQSRANAPRDAMYLREMALENDFPSFAQASFYYSRRQWPSPGMISHNYGPWFMRYIEEKYGKDKIAKIDELNAENLLSVLTLGLANDFGRTLEKALGVPPEKLYTDFKVWAKEQFATQMWEIAAQGITPSFQVTKLGYFSDQPAWSPDGKWIAYYHSDPLRFSGIRIIDPNGENDRQIVSGFVSFPSWSPQVQKLIYVKLDVHKNYYLYSDLYSYDLKENKETRLTFGERVYNAAFFPDGGSILLAKYVNKYKWEQKSPGTALAIFNLETKELKVLKEFADEAVVHSLEISPDGGSIALSIWKRGGYQDIYIMPAAGGELLPVTQDKAIDLDPTWSPDGQYILFSSDRDGVHNLYAYNLADDIFFKVTNVTSGAFDPDVSSDDQKIAFVGYSIDGYDIHTMEFNPQAWKQVSLPKETIPAGEGFPKTNYPIGPYDPGPSLAPKLWLPIISPEAVGVVTFGQDSLSQHAYSFVVGVDFKKREPFYYFDYANSKLVPTISFSLSKDSRGDKQSVNITFPLTVRLYSQQIISLGYQRSASVSEGQQGAAEGEAEALKISHRLSSSWSFFSLSGIDLFQDSLSIAITGEIKKEEGSEKLEKRLVLDWREHFQLPWNNPLGSHNLALKFTAGWSDVANPEKGFSLGGESGQFLLRGFKKDAFKGKQAISGSIEYGFPLLSLEQGLGYWPLFFDDLRASIFIDAGTAGEKLELSGFKLGIGEELNLSLVAGYLLFDFNLRLGVAQGLGEKSPVVYFTAGAAF